MLLQHQVTNAQLLSRYLKTKLFICQSMKGSTSSKQHDMIKASYWIGVGCPVITKPYFVEKWKWAHNAMAADERNMYKNKVDNATLNSEEAWYIILHSGYQLVSGFPKLIREKKNS